MRDVVDLPVALNEVHVSDVRGAFGGIGLLAGFFSVPVGFGTGDAFLHRVQISDHSVITGTISLHEPIDSEGSNYGYNNTADTDGTHQTTPVRSLLTPQFRIGHIV